jgi:hypothetical protein
MHLRRARTQEDAGGRGELAGNRPHGRALYTRAAPVVTGGAATAGAGGDQCAAASDLPCDFVLDLVAPPFASIEVAVMTASSPIV